MPVSTLPGSPSFAGGVVALPAGGGFVAGGIVVAGAVPGVVGVPVDGLGVELGSSVASLELLLSDDKTDPITHRLDALLSVNVPKDSAMVSTRLGSDTEVIVASPELAKRWQAATQPKDLSRAPWVEHPSIPANAHHQFRNQRGIVQRLAPIEARVVANTGDAIRSLVVGGAGFGVVPSQMVADDIRTGRMVRVLPDWRCRKVTVHACLPSRSHPPARVTFFLEELRAVFRLTGFEAQYAGVAPRHALRYPAQ